jgi:hypothetical protein
VSESSSSDEGNRYWAETAEIFSKKRRKIFCNLENMLTFALAIGNDLQTVW